MGARRSKRRAAGSPWLRIAMDVTFKGVKVRLRDGVVQMGVGLRLVPALVAENRLAVALRCLTDKAGRSGENWKEFDVSLTGVRSGVRSAGDDGGIYWEEEDGDGPRKRSSSSSITIEESGGSSGEARLYERRGDWKTSSGSTGSA